jgi:hypothetical protein
MAFTEAQVYGLRTNEDFVVRCMVQMAAAAVVVLAEVDTTPFNSQRVRWARLAIEDPRKQAEAMMWAIIGNALVYVNADNPTNITMTNLKDAVNAAINGLVRPLP